MHQPSPLFSAVVGFINLLKLNKRVSGSEILVALREDGRFIPLGPKSPIAKETIRRAADQLVGAFLYFGDLNLKVGKEESPEIPNPRLSWREILPGNKSSYPILAYLDYPWGPRGEPNERPFYVLVEAKTVN